jgi:4-diphosphocytidyl-2-C-methyl-D-erythritol kinase
MVVFPGAKINIGLYVTNRRNDGYHDIETFFYPIGFSDILEVVPNGEAKPGNIEIALSGLPVEGDSANNLVVKAYRLMNQKIPVPSVKVFLHKCIPTGAGLGGGSSDGASMLLVLNNLFDLNLSYCDLFSLASDLGSDCPFFLDPVPSFARGRGEVLVQSDVSLKGLMLLLFHPAKGISTQAAYRHVEVSRPVETIEKLTSSPVILWPELVQNVFEPYSFDQQPVIKQLKDGLYQSGALYASMTGSGSAVYGLFDREPEIPESLSEYLIWKERIG